MNKSHTLLYKFAAFFSLRPKKSTAAAAAANAAAAAAVADAPFHMNSEYLMTLLYQVY